MTVRPHPCIPKRAATFYPDTCRMASLSYELPHHALQERHRSQSDSNLLNPGSNGVTGPVMIRTESASELSPNKHQKKKSFLHKLVRPWKWKKKKKGNKESVHSQGNLLYKLCGSNYCDKKIIHVVLLYQIMGLKLCLTCSEPLFIRSLQAADLLKFL